MAAKKGGMRTTGDVVSWWVERLELNRSVSASYRRTMASLMRFISVTGFPLIRSSGAAVVLLVCRVVDEAGDVDPKARVLS